MKYIYFKGYYGFKNLGDDIFCVTADWLVNSFWVDKTPVFLGENLPIVSRKAIKVEFKNYYVKKVFEILVCIISWRIIYFGGSVLSKIKGKKDLRYYLNKYSFFHSKLGTIGTSLGPFTSNSDQNNIESFLAKFRFILVRDMQSMSLLKKMNLNENIHQAFSFDPAILIKDVYPSLQNKNKNKNAKGAKVGISLCHYESYKGKNISKEKEREEALMVFLEKISKQNNKIEEIVFFQFNGNEKNGDLEISLSFLNKINDNIKTSLVYYTSDTEKFCVLINECDFLVGVRLHSGILAYALDIPFMLIEYHPKCTEFLNTINHNFRFSNKDVDENVKIFNELLNEGSVPGLVKPEYFRELFLNEFKSIKNY